MRHLKPTTGNRLAFFYLSRVKNKDNMLKSAIMAEKEQNPPPLKALARRRNQIGASGGGGFVVLAQK